MSVRPSARNNAAPTGRIFMKFSYEYFSKFCWENRLIYLTRITHAFYEDLRTSMIISHSFLFRMRLVSNKRCKETQNTRSMFNNFFSGNRASYDIMWKKRQADHRRQYNKAHVHFLLHNWGYKHTLSISNTYYFSTTTVTRTLFGVTFNVGCSSRTEGLYNPDLQTVVNKVGQNRRIRY